MPKKYGVKEKDLANSESAASRFDEAVVLEHHELYGFLSGIASARATTDPTPEILERLDTLIGIMRSNRESAKRSTTPTPGRGANASAWCSSTSICFRTAPFWTT